MTRRALAALAALGLAFTFVACAPPGVDADDTDADEDVTSDEQHLSVSPGDLVYLGGVQVIAPDAGSGVFAEVILETGETRTLHLRTDLDAQVFLLHETLETEDDDAPPEEGATAQAAGESSAGNGSTAPCSDSAKALQPYKWTKTYDWFFNIGTTPSDNSKTNVESAIKKGISNITTARNSCGMADAVSATHAYKGHTTKGVQVTATGACGTSDGQNTVAFGDLPAGVLGVTCVWYSGSSAVEADIRLNKGDYKWYGVKPSNCSNRWSVEGVVTHEAGHAFGLAHVAESPHGNLTMSPAMNGPCQSTESTLGKGDVLGLQAKY